MDLILYNILVGFTCLLVGYLFGSIPVGIIIGKAFFHRDPRNEGSGNSGGTNVGRLFGAKAGAVSIILDMLKGVIPLLIAWLVIRYSGLREAFAEKGGALWDDGVLYVYLAPLGAAIGHCWPLFAGFRGGKAVSSLCGFGIISSWFLALLGGITFISALKAKKEVSLASLLTACLSIVLSWLIYGLQFALPEGFKYVFMWGWGHFLLSGWEYALVITIIAIMLIVRHAGNIKRLARHEERTIHWLK